MSDWSLYMIRTNNGDLYAGISSDVQRRFAEHVAGGNKCARYLRGKSPLRLVFSHNIGSRSDALKAEAAVKKLPKSAKEALISGHRSLQSLISVETPLNKSDQIIEGE
ncbi:MAG: GIY-YIG nuclease family protein [Candidatus Promineifilaceae bacterium]|nr:GIY-YIG nuclease family protein [Candidatus Promineifilaceae bacterium]